MSRLGFKTAVYVENTYIGELETVKLNQKNPNFRFPNNEIRIHHFTPNSTKRCQPLSVLQTITNHYSFLCKLEPSSINPHSGLICLHSACVHDLKTAVVLLGTEEIHLVAMPSKHMRIPCFWCYSVPCGLYDASLTMLNKHCLAIVFDLDETLVVANTRKMFEDKIEALMNRIEHETDPVRESGMIGELKRYMQDQTLLKQYAESDYVMDGGKMIKVQQEEVPLLSDVHRRVVRPVIRLPEKNIVLTRINPENRETSVLVRLRPAWGDFKKYLIAKGRKRFEVYVCTLAEREYALEMWRLLDPEAQLIESKKILDRVVCVELGARKSLLHVFQNDICHPKMAMIVDDRLNVWEDKDKPRVYVIPAFAPYYNPQAETAKAVPALCEAKNVAFNVRNSFFKEFDDNLLRKVSDIFYEDEVGSLTSATDVSNYLMPEEEKTIVNAPSDVVSSYQEMEIGSSKVPVVATAYALAPASKSAALPSEKPGLPENPFWKESKHAISTGPPIQPKNPRRTHIQKPQGGWIVGEYNYNRRRLGSGAPPPSISQGGWIEK